MKNSILALAIFLSFFSFTRAQELDKLRETSNRTEKQAGVISNKQEKIKLTHKISLPPLSKISFPLERNPEFPKKFDYFSPQYNNSSNYNNYNKHRNLQFNGIYDIYEYEKKQEQLKFEKQLNRMEFLKKNPKYKKIIKDVYNVVKPIHHFYKTYFKPVRSSEIRAMFDKVREADDKKAEAEKQIRWLWRRHIKPFPIYENNKIKIEVYPYSWGPLEGRITLRIKDVF